MLGSPLTPSDRRSLQVVSLVKETGELEISLNSAIVPQPRPDEVVLRVDAAPINPSDLILLLAGADANELASSGTAERPVLTGRVRSTTGLAGRLGQALPVGNEGAGTIVEAGSSAAAQALLGRVVAAAPGGGMYAEYRVLRADQCLVLHAGSSAVDGASACINPLTALGFVETMRREGHTALANTAAASNLGQMLVRICLKDGVPLLNIVRSFGTAWGVGGWLMTPFMQSLEPAKVAALKHRIAAELTTTFASSHSKQVSLSEALRLPAVTAYAKRATGAKYLVVPNQRS